MESLRSSYPFMMAALYLWSQLSKTARLGWNTSRCGYRGGKRKEIAAVLAFMICVLLPAGLFFAYVLVNFGADFRREAHRLGRRGVRKMPVQPPLSVSGPARPHRRAQPVADVIVMKAAKKPSKRGVA